MKETKDIAALEESVTKLKAVLDKERDEHKATKTQFQPIREALALHESASLDDILGTLNTRLADVDLQLGGHTEALTKERDEAIAARDKLIADFDGHRIDTAIDSALSRSTIIDGHRDDARNFLRPLFGVKDGAVVTIGGDTGEVGGMTPAQFIASRLTAIRPLYFPHSVSGPTPRGGLPTTQTMDDRCFDKSSPHYNFTRAMGIEAANPDFAARARRKYGW